MIRNVNEIRQNLVKIMISKIFEPTFRSIIYFSFKFHEKETMNSWIFAFLCRRTGMSGTRRSGKSGFV